MNVESRHRQQDGCANAEQRIQGNFAANAENQHRQQNGCVHVEQKIQGNSVVSVERQEDNVSRYI